MTVYLPRVCPDGQHDRGGHGGGLPQRRQRLHTDAAAERRQHQPQER